MWILFRLVVAAIAFVIRMVHRAWRPSPTGTLDGLPYYVKNSTHKGSPNGFRIGLPLRSPVIFELTLENDTDRWYKSLGLVTEIQSGDADFDRRVFVACDHPGFGAFLRDRQAVRPLISSVLGRHIKRITADGATLWLQCEHHRHASPEDAAMLQKLHREFRKLADAVPSRLRDPFVARALAVEAMVCSVMIYAAAGILEWFIMKEDYHVASAPLVARGLLMAAAICAAVGGATYGFLRGSSRAGRLITAYGLLLLLSAPFAGIQMASDLNRSLDRAPAEIAECPLHRHEVQVHRRGRGGRSYSYHLYVGPSRTPVRATLSGHIKVDEATYHSVKGRNGVRLTIGPGWLGIPWYRRIEPGE